MVGRNRERAYNGIRRPVYITTKSFGSSRVSKGWDVWMIDPAHVDLVVRESLPEEPPVHFIDHTGPVPFESCNDTFPFGFREELRRSGVL